MAKNEYHSLPPADLMATMKETSRVYMMAGEDGDCSDPPAEDQMMQCDEAMEIACQDVSDSQTSSF